MINKMENLLVPKRSIYIILGALCINPFLIREKDLNKEDFAIELYKIIFSSIYNLVYSNPGIQKIDQIDIDNYLSTYPSLYKIWEKYNGYDYIKDCIANTNLQTFNNHYDRLKKFSLLRDLVNKDISVLDLYNYKSNDFALLDKDMKKIDKMSLDEISDHYLLKVIDIRDKYKNKKLSKDFKAGDDIDELLDSLNEQPDFGHPFKNGYYNYFFRGKQLGNFMLRSASTGGGKTRLSLADILDVGIDEIYSFKSKKYIKNGPCYPSLIISTEINKKKLQILMLAYISGLDTRVIKNGNYSEEVKNRLDTAKQILKRAPVYFIYTSDFSIQDIELDIEKYILEKNVKYIAFDYIQLTPKLSRTMSKEFGLTLREDQILVQFSSALKRIAESYNVFILSGTQLNRTAKDENNRDTSGLRGASSIGDKIDYGIMTFKTKENDLIKIKHILEGRIGLIKPNFSHWIYKNRDEEAEVIIWSNMDLGNLRERPLFVTDIDYNLLEINPVDIIYDNSENSNEEEILSNSDNFENELIDF